MHGAAHKTSKRAKRRFVLAFAWFLRVIKVTDRSERRLARHDSVARWIGSWETLGDQAS